MSLRRKTEELLAIGRDTLQRSYVDREHTYKRVESLIRINLYIFTALAALYVMIWDSLKLSQALDLWGLLAVLMLFVSFVGAITSIIYTFRVYLGRSCSEVDAKWVEDSITKIDKLDTSKSADTYDSSVANFQFALAKVLLSTAVERDAHLEEDRGMLLRARRALVLAISFAIMAGLIGLPMTNNSKAPPSPSESQTQGPTPSTELAPAETVVAPDAPVAALQFNPEQGRRVAIFDAAEPPVRVVLEKKD
jgi:hypothetical protein